MIKQSLQAKLIFSYLAVALLTVLVVTAVIRLSSGQQFLHFVVEQQANILVDEATAYYATNQAWDGFAEAYGGNIDRPPGYQDQSTQPNGPKKIRGKHGLVDLQYRALIPYMGYEVGQVLSAKDRENLIPVEVNGETVGWVIPDQGIQFELSSAETVFLQRASQAVGLAALAGFGGAILMGIFLARNFLKPINTLTGAAKKMAAGDLEQQVAVHSQDELGQLTQTFNQMSAGLASADRQRKQLTADITHDLSTPLQVIAGYLEMIAAEDLTLTPERARLMLDEIELLRRLVGDLSLLTSVESQELPLEIEAVAPQELLGRVQQSYQAIGAKANVVIDEQVAPHTPMIRIDPVRMVQVIGNLVDNAIRYTPAGGKVMLTAGLAQGKVELRVKDTGSGILDSDLPYVFDRFYQGDKARTGGAGKAGLGLAIAQALVVAQGGSIQVESGGEPGASFVMRFDPA